MSRLFFKLYHAGLNNCRMSLDIGVGLAHITGRTFVPYGVGLPWNSHPLLRTRGDRSERATVLDLLTIPVDVEYGHVQNRKTNIAGARRLLSAQVVDSVLRTDAAEPAETEEFQAFRNGRKHVFTLGKLLQEDIDIVVDVNTLGMYSHFFHGDDLQRAELRRVLSLLRPRKPYRELAGQIALSLKPFNAVHIRRGDFRYAQLAPRAAVVSGREVARNLAARFSRQDRLVVCTDSSSDDAWFAPIRRHFRDVVFFNQLVLGSWRAEFLRLPHHDDSVLALITQLVAAQAESFVGTLFSTFTALIQRLRGFAGKSREFLYCYSDWDSRLVPFQRCEFASVQDGPYSWNRIRYPVVPGVYSWFREWPESFQCSTAVDIAAGSPARVVALRAADAQVHGLRARYEHSAVHDNIGFWTNRNDYVTWTFRVAARMFCRVEIRYACPDDCAGSTFSVALDGDEGVSARVKNTGGWTMFCDWQPVGIIDLAPGKRTLVVRILTMRAKAAMNLAAIRLVESAID